MNFGRSCFFDGLQHQFLTVWREKLSWRTNKLKEDKVIPMVLQQKIFKCFYFLGQTRRHVCIRSCKRSSPGTPTTSSAVPESWTHTQEMIPVQSRPHPLHPSAQVTCLHLRIRLALHGNKHSQLIHRLTFDLCCLQVVRPTEWQLKWFWFAVGGAWRKCPCCWLIWSRTFLWSKPEPQRLVLSQRNRWEPSRHTQLCPKLKFRWKSICSNKSSFLSLF